MSDPTGRQVASRRGTASANGEEGRLRRSHHKQTFWDENRSPIVRFCHRAIFSLIFFVLVFSVVSHGATTWMPMGAIMMAVCAAALLWALRLVIIYEVQVVFSSLGAPVLCIGIYALLRYMLADCEPVARPSMMLGITGVLFFFIVLNDIRHRWQITTLVWTITGLGVVVALYGTFQVILGAESVLGRPQYPAYHGKASGTFHRPADLAVFLHMAFAVATANVLFSRRSEREKIGLALAAVVICAGLVFTFSSRHWLGWLAMLFVLGTFVLRKGGWRFRWLVAAVCLAAVVAVGIFLFSKTVSREPYRGVSATQVAKKSGLAIGRGNVWLGAGGGMFRWAYPAHRTVQGTPTRGPVEYLNIFAEYGTAGVVLFLWATGAFLLAAVQIFQLRDNKYAAQRLSNRYAFAVAGLTAGVGLLVDAAVDANLRVGGILFPWLTLVAATLTCGVHRRVGETEELTRPGRYMTLRVHGLSRFVLAAALLGLVILMATRLRTTYPAQFALNRARTAMEVMNWEDAERYALQAWTFDGKRNFEAADLLGDIHLARATWFSADRAALAKRALYWYAHVKTVNPYALDTRIKVGRLHDLLQRRDLAYSAYREALAGDPRNASYHVQLARHFERWGDTVQAERNYRIARRLRAGEFLSIDEPVDDTPDS